MKRESGYYWVKLNDEWRVGEFSYGEWWFCGNQIYCQETQIEEINENRIKAPNE